jgi:hypothetical protein
MIRFRVTEEIAREYCRKYGIDADEPSTLRTYIPSGQPVFLMWEEVMIDLETRYRLFQFFMKQMEKSK